jgi:putative transposase
VNLVIGSFRHVTLANASKVEALVALFPAFRAALGGLASVTRREVLAGESLSRWRVMPTHSLPFVSQLSARQMKSAQNMTHTAVSGWQQSLVVRVRELITGSELPEHRKTVLYRLNARKAWWAREVTLPWFVDVDNELVACTAQQAATDPRGVLLPVTGDDLKLLRRLVKHAQKRVRYPDLRRVNTLVLDSIIAKPTRVQTADLSGRVRWWVQIATLTRGRPVRIPLIRNPYFDRNHRDGTLCGVVQLHLVRDQHRQPCTVAVSLLLEHPDAELRTTGEWLGIDFGLSSALFATSDGQLVGQRMLDRLRELDAILQPYTADLQRRGVPLKTDRYYQKLHARIRGYVANEIGRLLNRIAARDGDQAVIGLVVERLDFRGGGLSRPMNRLITRTGRAVLKTRLAALTTKAGIAVETVPSPYSSQECSGCGYARKSNRPSRSRFRCGFCGKRLHADVNAARVIRSRRSRPLPDHRGPRSRKNTLHLLDRHHRHRWNLPAHGAVPGITGALGQPAQHGRVGKRTNEIPTDR